MRVQLTWFLYSVTHSAFIRDQVSNIIIKANSTQWLMFLSCTRLEFAHYSMYSAAIPPLRTDKKLRRHWLHFIFVTCIFWVGSPKFGPPTSLQNKSDLGLPASSWPQVAVAEIREPWAMLKYGGLKLKPVTSLTDSWPFASPKSATDRVKTAARRRWAPLILLAMFHVC